MKTTLKMAVSILMLASPLLCGSAFAGSSWLCSIVSAVAADEDGTVGQPDLGELERPTFFRVDMDKKEVTILAPASRRGEVTKIENAREKDGTWTFSGTEDTRAWTLIITPKGHVTLSITTDGAVWSIFGSALLEGEAAARQPKK